MVIPDSITIRRRLLAAELLRLRGRRHAWPVAKAVGWSPSKLSRYETGAAQARRAEVAVLLAYYEVTGEHGEYLLGLSAGKHDRPWQDDYAGSLPAGYPDYIGLEEGATAIRVWAPDVIPDLLQTEAYARHLLSVRGHAAAVTLTTSRQRLAVLVRRQAILDRLPAPHVAVIIDETVLHRSAAAGPGGGVMRDQLCRAGRLAARRGITVQVLPAARVRPVAGGPFTVLSFGGDEPLLPDIAAVEHAQGIRLEEDEAAAYAYGVAFSALAQAALDPDVSGELIRNTAGG